MKFTPAALISTTASFAFGVGTGRSTYPMTSGPPVLFIWIAFMLAFDAGDFATAADFVNSVGTGSQQARFWVLWGANSCFLTFCPGHSLRVRMDAIDAAAVEQVLKGNHD